jgi:hypothetical protein
LQQPNVPPTSAPRLTLKTKKLAKQRQITGPKAMSENQTPKRKYATVVKKIPNACKSKKTKFSRKKVR